jgi:hypothetical protein
MSFCDGRKIDNFIVAVNQNHHRGKSEDIFHRNKAPCTKRTVQTRSTGT